MSELKATVVISGPDADSLAPWGDTDSIALSPDSPAWLTAEAIRLDGLIYTGTFQGSAASQAHNASGTGCACTTGRIAKTIRTILSGAGCACSRQNAVSRFGLRGWGWVRTKTNSGDWKTRRV